MANKVLSIDTVSGIQEFLPTDEPIDAIAKLVIAKAGTNVGTRQKVNLIEGTNVTLTVADNPGSDRVDVTIATSGGGGSGTVTSASVVSANGLAGTVATATTTPAITLSTTITGVLKGNGMAISAAANSDLPTMTATVGGAVPTPPNNTTTFLRGDGTFATPSGGGGSVATDTIFDAKGDLPVGTAADTAAKLTVGANNLVLTADSAQSTGLKWAKPWVQETNAQTGTSYTLALADEGKLVTLSNSSAITLTVPPNSSVAFDVGTYIDLAQISTGTVIIAPGSGVTLNATPGLRLRSQYSGATLRKTATDTWIIFGDLAV